MARKITLCPEIDLFIKHVYTSIIFLVKVDSTRTKKTSRFQNDRVTKVCFPPPCRLHSPPSLPRVAAQEALQSRKTTGRRINIARSGPVMFGSCLGGGPAAEVQVRPIWFNTGKSRTGSFSCDAS